MLLVQRQNYLDHSTEERKCTGMHRAFCCMGATVSLQCLTELIYFFPVSFQRNEDLVLGRKFSFKEKKQDPKAKPDVNCRSHGGGVG